MWGDGGPYARWAAFLEQWSAGAPADPADLPALAPADLPPDGWERLGNRLSGAVSQRLQDWARALSAGLSGARDEFSVARALVQARGGLHPVRSLAAHPALPEDLRRRLAEIVDTSIASAQDQLERQVDGLRRGGAPKSVVDARLRTIRDNPLTAAAPAARPDAWLGATAGRRRVVRP
ncbi:hypothetical protein [Dactylosporangium sp. CA-139066]|uniref:hypothetical protein n=1 Tax=Dactylosporangium sp. CA-139066 TaxID=3239930 RepID=UPI003D8AF037